MSLTALIEFDSIVQISRACKDYLMPTDYVEIR